MGVAGGMCSLNLMCSLSLMMWCVFEYDVFIFNSVFVLYFEYVGFDFCGF
ncbi:hypothetical protein Hanom_Chr09g00794781 [Helianthus anomalus]